MKGLALVLGGGGPVGIAWETGIIAGLAEEGVDLSGAELVIGTSAGSVVGAQLALGRHPSQMLQAQLATEARSEGDRSLQEAAQANMQAFLEMFTRLRLGSGRPEDLRREIGAFALRAQTISEETWLASFGRTLGEAPWPERDFRCTAVDAEDGSFMVWTRESGVPLVRAVASSCAVPGIFPPVTINGRRYMDGGVRSGTNADLARGWPKVVVLSVMGARRNDPLAENARLVLERELKALEESGSQVFLIRPDEASLDAFGLNLMDFRRRRGAAEAGYRQGKAEAVRLRALLA
jgi:NTE family protein